MGDEEERLLEEEKSLWRRLGDGDEGNLGIAFGGGTRVLENGVE